MFMKFMYKKREEFRKKKNYVLTCLIISAAVYSRYERKPCILENFKLLAVKEFESLFHKMKFE